MAAYYQTGVPSPDDHSYRGKEIRCNALFEVTKNAFGHCFHLHTDGNRQQVIFSTPEEYDYGMNLVAICAHKCPNVTIITFQLMSNHVHFIVCGTKEDIAVFFSLFKKKLRRYFSSVGKTVDLSGFEYNLVNIDNIESLRNQIAYTNRNGFLVQPEHTPFSYPYGANSYYFNRDFVDKMPVFGDLTYDEKRRLLKSHDLDLPDNFLIFNGFISPLSYCMINLGERIFNDAHQYFNRVSRPVESFKDIAKMFNDKVFYTDDELSSIIFAWCRKNSEFTSATQLNLEKKQELAKMLHFEYNADNSKISRLIRLPETVLNQIFPKGI